MLPSFIELNVILPSFTGFLLSFTRLYQVFIGFHWVSPSFTGFYRVFSFRDLPGFDSVTRVVARFLFFFVFFCFSVCSFFSFLFFSALVFFVRVCVLPRGPSAA